jgi:hypothetical protein
LQKGEDMSPKHGDKERVVTRGMLMDESATPARHSLVTPQELPPSEGDQFDSRFALLDERERGDATKRPGGRQEGADKPLTPDETTPPKRS